MKSLIYAIPFLFLFAACNSSQPMTGNNNYNYRQAMAVVNAKKKTKKARPVKSHTVKVKKNSKGKTNGQRFASSKIYPIGIGR